MVREIVHCQVGQCGNQIGNAFWETMRKEHNLDESGKYQPINEKSIGPDDLLVLDKMNVYFHEAGDRRFVPRCCLIDLEPGTLDVIKANPIGKMFKPDNFLFGASGKYCVGIMCCVCDVFVFFEVFLWVLKTI